MAAKVEITSCQINGLTKAPVTDRREVQVTLCVEGPVEHMSFALYERNDKLVWQSGRLPWSPNCTLTDLPLEPCRTYRLDANVSGVGAGAGVSKYLRTGLMDRPWSARWIEPEQEPGIKEREIQFFEQFVPMPDHFGGHDRLRPVQELQRTFTVEKLPERATLCASAHGVYALWLNGQRVDERRLASETTPYESMLYYQVYDLTGLIKEGENTLTILLADGWWIGRIGLTGDSCQYGDRLGFLGQLELNYGDHAETIVTDESFVSRPSYIRYADLMMGEKWDLNAPAAPWMPCKTVGQAGDTLVLQTIEPIAT